MVQVGPQRLHVTWETLPEDFVLPDDPVENIQHPFLAAALTDALATAGRITPEMLVASNFGLVSTIGGQTVVKAPDWLWVPRVNPVLPGVNRRSYTPYLEGDGVAVVMEFLSDTEMGEYSYRPTYPYGKLYYYEQILKVPTYVIFDQKLLSLAVRRLEDGRYVNESPNAHGHYWIPELQLWLGLWEGERVGVVTHWLRWWNEAGHLLLWASEQSLLERQRAEQERQRAEQEREVRRAAAAKLLAMGLSIEQVAEALQLSTAEVQAQQETEHP
ncbi:hypothetical protein GS597_07805 [Synechococcales cyanobacterium C]|uniref:Putative restriction endonuclease domain-containing protein n=1 Tax=Petrachloros mirabilis ULC683 TaxID=2781853 RepID=A0A8K2A7T3_9CYAN|nr:Uma2 family endonuclease [Petrachloros mirabilis]NCJ06415.1 hypothetical protein [Petrachloros mirabilis ULC683]